MDQRYMSLSEVPTDATKKIQAGKLKGKSDINPQWRYEAMTEVFGLCGEGWKFEITNTIQVPVPATGELMIFVFLNLYIKGPDGWSAPIPGSGGDYLIVKDKNGIHGNDEGFKMATTDALGTAAKMIGVAASVYRGTYRTKYERQSESYASENEFDYKPEKPQPPQHPTQKMANGDILPYKIPYIKDAPTAAQVNSLEVMCQYVGKNPRDMAAYYKVANLGDLKFYAYRSAYKMLASHLIKMGYSQGKDLNWHKADEPAATNPMESFGEPEPDPAQQQIFDEEVPF